LPLGKAFDELKALYINAPVLAYFDGKKKTTVQAYAGQSGLVAVLLIDGRPVEYASRAMTATEQTYAQSEKQLLSTTFAMERFHYYVYGRDVIVESDHKPLIVIVKSLSSALKRLQRMLLRLQRYNFQLVYRPGSELVLAGTLSRAYPRQTRPMTTLNSQKNSRRTDDEQMQQLRAVSSQRTIDFINAAAADDKEQLKLMHQIAVG